MEINYISIFVLFNVWYTTMKEICLKDKITRDLVDAGY